MGYDINILNRYYNLIVILGPTASGKTRMAVELAALWDGEIISADSRQVYQGLDIGSGKDIYEYQNNGKLVPYHIIDVIDPNQEFNLFSYQKLFTQAYRSITERGKIPIMVGGTGLYIESVVMNYCLSEVPENKRLRNELYYMSMFELTERLLRKNPSVHNTTDLLDRNRLIRAIEIAEFERDSSSGKKSKILPEIKPLIIGIRWDRKTLRKRITERLNKRLSEGMIEEIELLHQKGIPWEKFDYWGLEYRYISRYVQGKITYESMYEELNTKIHQYAKRQETWFRRMEKKGTVINWIDGDDDMQLKNFFYRIIHEISEKLS